MIYGYGDWEKLGTAGVPLHVVSLRRPNGDRRFPVDVIREEILPLPSSTWLVFQGEELGETPAYAADLMRRLISLKNRWIGQASPAFVQRPELLKLAQQSHCQALVLNGVQISTQYLSTEAPSPLEAMSQLVVRLRQLPRYGILSVTRFIFGSDTDDEGVFERTVRFCQEARLGLPHFSILTPLPGSPLFGQLENEGRLLHTHWQDYDGSHAVFQPKLMTPEALENGLCWTRQQVYCQRSIWRRVLTWKRTAFRHLVANYEQRRVFSRGPRGLYTDAMQLLSRLSQPIQVRERASFISTFKDAVGETRRQWRGALLRIRAVRDARLQALTLRLEGVLDASGATEVLQRIQQALQAGYQKVVLDLKGLELVSATVLTRFLEENAQALIALRDRVVFRHLHVALDAMRANLGGALPNAELFRLATEE